MYALGFHLSNAFVGYLAPFWKKVVSRAQPPRVVRA